MKDATSMSNIGEPWMWGAFIAFVLAMLALDLFVFGGRKVHKVSVREAAAWSPAEYHCSSPACPCHTGEPLRCAMPAFVPACASRFYATLC